jgi:penicillin-binding protein 2
MACLVSSIARGDYLTPPTILKKPGLPHYPDKPYSEAWSAVVDGMRAAVEAGTARLAQVPGLAIAGKTGTAQVMVQGRELNLAWFLGFAPIESPQVAIAVVVEETSPDDAYAGGLTAAPVARYFFDQWQKIQQESGLLPDSSNRSVEADAQ